MLDWGSSEERSAFESPPGWIHADESAGVASLCRDAGLPHPRWFDREADASANLQPLQQSGVHRQMCQGAADLVDHLYFLSEWDWPEMDTNTRHVFFVVTQ